MRILGLDPGTLAMGYGIIESDEEHDVVKFGCLKLSSRESFPARLKKINDEICAIIATYKPVEFAIESLFYAKNPKVAIKMGHARGVAIVAAANNELPVFEYSPREVKQAVVGNGAASKQQVQRMVRQLLNLKELPEPLDASDALAVAICHKHRMNSKL